MANAIYEGKTKKLFDMPRIGEDFLFSVNETKRLVALYSRQGVSPLARTLRIQIFMIISTEPPVQLLN
jgi:hypothetical protein